MEGRSKLALTRLGRLAPSGVRGRLLGRLAAGESFVHANVQEWTKVGRLAKEAFP